MPANEAELAMSELLAMPELLPILLAILGFILVVVAITLVSTWRLFTKAGVPGWKSIIPIYSIYIMIKIAFGEDKNWLFFTTLITSITGFAASLIGRPLNSELELLATLIGLIANIYLNFNFMRRYAGKGMSIASLFIPVIIYPIIAFSSKYQYASPIIGDDMNG